MFLAAYNRELDPNWPKQKRYFSKLGWIQGSKANSQAFLYPALQCVLALQGSKIEEVVTGLLSHEISCPAGKKILPQKSANVITLP